MTGCVMSGVLFARDARKLAGFYTDALAGKLLRQDADHTVLDWNGFHLVVHQIPAHLVASVQVSVPPQRREQGALRLDFPVDDVAHARRMAHRLGGQIDEVAPPWAGGDVKFFLGFDPEGNVFGVRT